MTHLPLKPLLLAAGLFMASAQAASAAARMVVGFMVSPLLYRGSGLSRQVTALL